jgi:16S rRNA (adenine1518-N6/adenine1519-N6)-dimethyltransferase
VTVRKRFGQHFLEPAWVRKVVDAIAPSRHDTFLEVGPGRGALTIPLAERAGRVIAVEIDRDLAAELPARVPPNVQVVCADVLAADLSTLVGSEPVRLRVAGNLPYNISTPVLFQLVALSAHRPVRDATLMLQKEVADRLVAAPGTKEYGVLPVLVGRHARIERLLTLPPGAFRPPPAVMSAVIRLVFLAPSDVTDAPRGFEALVRALFMRRRKTMSNALAAAIGVPASDAAARLEQLGIEPRRRPETLTLREFLAVAGIAPAARG